MNERVNDAIVGSSKRHSNLDAHEKLQQIRVGIVLNYGSNLTKIRPIPADFYHFRRTLTNFAWFNDKRVRHDDCFVSSVSDQAEARSKFSLF